MRYAHVGNTRLEAYPKGKATCQVCDGELYAACGEIQIWHWRHEVLDCDTWYESMSDWHIDWQNRFPEKWREVVITKKGVKHIADIQTINKKVVEFQHSPMSSTEIKKREAFYQDMLWVIDARDFKDNFEIRSNVTTQLRYVEQYKSNEKSQAKEDLLESIESTKKRIRNLEREIEQVPSDISTIEIKLERYAEIKLDIKAFVKDHLMESWLDKRYYSDYKTRDLTAPLERHYRPDIVLVLDHKKTLLEEMDDIQKKLNRYSELELLKIKNDEFKIADYDILRSEDFKRIKAIQKHSLLTPYHDIKQIQSEAEFLNYKADKDKFHFAIDLSKAIPKYSNEIAELAQYLEIEEENIKKIEQLIIGDVKINLEEIIKSEKGAIKEIDDELLFKQEHLTGCKSSLIEKEKNFDSVLEELLKTIDKEYRIEEGEIMKKNKGRYTFTWKHERKSWRSAQSPILFDVGEYYLFLIEGEGKLRKVPITTFLARLIDSDEKR